MAAKGKTQRPMDGAMPPSQSPAGDMPPSDLTDFASTPETGLPQKVKKRGPRVRTVGTPVQRIPIPKGR